MSKGDWDRLQYYSRKVKSLTFRDIDPRVHPTTYLRIAQLQSSTLFPSLRRLRFVLGDTSKSHTFLSSFLLPLLDSVELINIRRFEDIIVGPFLATLSPKSQLQMPDRIVRQNGQISVDILKKSIAHYKHLESLELSDAFLMSDFSLWEVLGTLPCLKNFTLKAFNPASHPAQAPANSKKKKKKSQSVRPKYFEALESLFVKGSFLLIQLLLCFIDSPCLNSIEVYPVINKDTGNHETEDFTPSMTVIASKWSQSLKKLLIGSSFHAPHNAISEWFMLLTDLYEMETFHLLRWRMEDIDDDVGYLAKSWPKLITLKVLPSDQTFMSLSTLRIIAESCPDLRHLSVLLDSSIPPFDGSSKGLDHKLEVLTLGRDFNQIPLEYQIRMARHLDSIFPHLKSIERHSGDATWSIIEVIKLCQDLRRGQ